MAIKLDEVDFQLLTALQVDADRTNVELARLVGLSPAATLHRVRDRILVVIVVLGAILRIRQYAYGRSLWFDELMIASNVRPPFVYPPITNSCVRLIRILRHAPERAPGS